MSEMQAESASHWLHSNIPKRGGVSVHYDVFPQARSVNIH